MNFALICLRTQLCTAAAFLALSVFLLGIQKADAAEFVEPASGSHVTDDGTVSLVWAESSEGDTGRRYEVRRWQEGTEGDGVLVYEGEDTASFVSGLGEGRYAFRIRSRTTDGAYPDWGDAALQVEVDYIDMSIVWPLMGAGFVCFVVLISTIYFGRRAVASDPETQLRAK